MTMTTTAILETKAITLHDEKHFDSIVRGQHSKTLDLGLNGVTLSTGPTGDFLQLGCFHPKHGIVVASPFAQFDGDRFYDSEYVRQYRTTLLQYARSGKRGFGIHFDGVFSNLEIGYIDNKWPVISYAIGDLLITTTVFIGEDGNAIQSTNVKSTSSTAVKLKYSLELTLSVNRASYGQLTEGGPIPIPPLKNQLELFDGSRSWAIRNPNLDATVQGSLYCDGEPLQLGPYIKEATTVGEPIVSSFNGDIDILPHQSRTLTATFHLHPGSSLFKFSTLPRILDRESSWRIKQDSRGLIIKRNLEYILGNCTIPVAQGSVCFITDHVALPLGWNRDNYWQVRFLLDVHKHIGQIAQKATAIDYCSRIHSAVRGHLNWVFRLAQRPNGYWHRSYLTTGVPKDGPVFQQDQQCYPILELCDFYQAFPSESTFVESILAEDTIPSIISALKTKQDPETSLYSTDETPGDDAVDHPFHFSSHILLWYTLTRLADLLQTLCNPSSINSQLDFKILRYEASQLRKAIFKHFVAENPLTGTQMFAYLTNGAGIHTFYHDANDIPTLLIPDWGFILSDSEKTIWSRTMDFGLSMQNDGGYYAEGRFGGLGSIHTRAPWPLGYAQEFIYANIMGNSSALQDSWRRIQGSMFWDGLFSEAVDAETGDCISKAWFSWPGSIIGSALLRYGSPRPLY